MATAVHRARRHTDKRLSLTLDHCAQEGLDYLSTPRLPEKYLEARQNSLAYRQATRVPGGPCTEMTVLVATVPRRRPFLDLLLAELSRQGLAVHWDDDPELSTGDKRNRLVETVKTPYFTFVDDDDWISADYREVLTGIIRENPCVDSVTFSILYMKDNDYPRLIRMGGEYAGWEIEGETLYRKILPWGVLKTSLQGQVPYPSVFWGEDRIWADRIAPLIQSQVVSSKVIYHYAFLSGDSETNREEYVRQFYEQFPDYLPLT